MVSGSIAEFKAKYGLTPNEYRRQKAQQSQLRDIRIKQGNRGVKESRSMSGGVETVTWKDPKTGELLARVEFNIPSKIGDKQIDSGIKQEINPILAQQRYGATTYIKDGKSYYGEGLKGRPQITETKTVTKQIPKLTTQQRAEEALGVFGFSTAASFTAAKLAATSATAASVYSVASGILGGATLGVAGVFGMMETGFSKQFEGYGRAFQSVKAFAPLRESDFLKNIVNAGSIFEQGVSDIGKGTMERPELLFASIAGGVAGSWLSGLKMPSVFNKKVPTAKYLSYSQEKLLLKGTGLSPVTHGKVLPDSAAGWTKLDPYTATRIGAGFPKRELFGDPLFSFTKSVQITKPSVTPSTKWMHDVFTTRFEPKVGKELFKSSFGFGALFGIRSKQQQKQIQQQKTKVISKTIPTLKIVTTPMNMQGSNYKLFTDFSTRSQQKIRQDLLVGTLTKESVKETAIMKIINEDPFTQKIISGGGIDPSFFGWDIPERRGKKKKKKKKGRRVKNVFTDSYVPSLVGLLSGKTISKVPAFTSGIGIRKKVSKKGGKKRGKK